MAVLVAQDHPNVIRRKPASGDGGIDLLIPDGDGFIVQQIKGFADRIKGPQRRQIKASWDEMCRDPRLDRPITGWHLVVPTNPTPGEQAWFEEFTVGAAFPCEWRGEVHWDSLASKHPHVVDYYFGGGRDRIRSRATAMVDPGEALSALDVAASHEKMRAVLNRDDPHYQYFFQESRTSPRPEELPPCVLARTTALTDGTFLTVMVVPRHDHALADEPITGSLNVTVVDESLVESVSANFERFRRFGSAVEFPEGTVTMELSAPGGLGGTFVGGSARIVPAPPSERAKWRIGVSDPRGKSITELRFETVTLSSGTDGALSVLVDESETIEAEIQIEKIDGDTGRLGATFSMRSLVHRPASEILEAVRFLNQLRAPNRCVIRPRHGRQVFATIPIDSDEAIVPDWLATFVDDLDEVQEIAEFTIKVPEDITDGFVSDLHAFARMLRGETVSGTWTDVVFELKPGVSRAEAEQTMGDGGVLVHEQGVTLEFDEGAVDLGRVQTVFASARVDPLQLRDSRKVRVIPGPDDTATKRLLRDD